MTDAVRTDESVLLQSGANGCGGGVEERKLGGIKLGEEKVHCLKYADDMVPLAENEEGMVHMPGKLEGS